MNDFINHIKTFFIILFCLIIAVAHPLSVVASDVPSVPGASESVSEFNDNLNGLGVGIFAGLAGGAVTYIVSAETGFGLTALAAIGITGGLGPVVCGIIACVCIGCCVTLTINAISDAINRAAEQGYFQTFVDRVIEAFSNGLVSITAKLSMVPSFFGYVYDWVMEHIIHHYDEAVSLTPFSSDFETNCYQPQVTYSEAFTSSTPYLENAKAMDLFAQITIDNSIISSVSDESLRVDIANNIAVENINNGYVTYLSAYCEVGTYGAPSYLRKVTFYQELTSGDNTITCVNSRSENDWASSSYYRDVYFPYPYLYVQDDFKQLGFVDYYKMTRGTSVSYRLLHDSFGSPQASYYLNGEKLMVYGNNSYQIRNSDNTKIYSVELDDGTEITSFRTIPNFLYYVACENVLVHSKSISGDDDIITDSASNTTVKTVNPYYNYKHDVLKSTADTVKAKPTTEEGEDEGVISMGVGVLPGINVGSGSMSGDVAGTGTIAGQITGTTILSDVASVTSLEVSGEAVSDVEIPLSVGLQLAVNNIKLGLGELKYKFPFDVIFSVADWLKALVTEGEPLVIDYNFNVPLMREPIHVHIDFSRYQTLVTVGNWIVLVSVAIGLLIASKHALEAI